VREGGASWHALQDAQGDALPDAAAMLTQMETSTDTGNQPFYSLVEDLQNRWMTALTKLAETRLCMGSGKAVAEADLVQMVAETCDLCTRMQLTQHVSVKRLVSGCLEDHTVMLPDVHAHWSTVARRLMLQPVQVMTLLRLRHNLLGTLAEIYLDRKAGRGGGSCHIYSGFMALGFITSSALAATM